MTEERAALLISEYANGLRRELALLGASEVNDLVSEIVAMLRDASLGDAGLAAVEIERLGPPAELARTVLEQHGLDGAPGLQTASWWRLGVAAPLDIAVGLAAPVAASALAWRVFASLSPAATGIETAGWVLLLLGVVGAAFGLAWRYWRPWRVGGGEATAGMALSGIAVVILGGARTVVPTADLATAGLAHPHRSKVGSALTVLLAAAALIWAVFAVGTPLTAGDGRDVAAFAGDPAMQQRSAREAVDQLYSDALDLSDGGTSLTGADGLPLNNVSPFPAILRERALSGALTSYTIDGLAGPYPGEWTVEVAETGKDGTNAATVYVGLRVTWGPDGLTTPEWIITGYDTTGTP